MGMACAIYYCHAIAIPEVFGCSHDKGVMIELVKLNVIILYTYHIATAKLSRGKTYAVREENGYSPKTFVVVCLHTAN